MSGIPWCVLRFEPFGSLFEFSDGELAARQARRRVAIGPIFVRKAAKPAVVGPDVIPHDVRARLISVRAYDPTHSMIEAIVRDGNDAASVLTRQFASRDGSATRLHDAKPECFSCAAHRLMGRSGECTG
jgi:hypothetical protein